MASPIELPQKSPGRKTPSTKHPCEGMAFAHRRAFEQIATGTHSSLLPKKSIEALVARGLIERRPDLILGSSEPRVHVKHHEIPLWAHQQWCAWCAEQAKRDEEKESKK